MTPTPFWPTPTPLAPATPPHEIMLDVDMQGISYSAVQFWNTMGGSSDAVDIIQFGIIAIIVIMGLARVIRGIQQL